MEAAHLIDTNIVSELARKHPDPGVVAFIEGRPRLAVSVILFHELAYGIDVAPDGQKGRLTAFLEAMRTRFGERAIAIDGRIAEAAGRQRAQARRTGRMLTVADSLIAATALVTGTTLVTRNIKDFEELGLPLLNPFSDSA